MHQVLVDLRIQDSWHNTDVAASLVDRRSAKVVHIVLFQEVLDIDLKSIYRDLSAPPKQFSHTCRGETGADCADAWQY